MCVCVCWLALSLHRTSIFHFGVFLAVVILSSVYMRKRAKLNDEFNLASCALVLFHVGCAYFAILPLSFRYNSVYFRNVILYCIINLYFFVFLLFRSELKNATLLFEKKIRPFKFHSGNSAIKFFCSFSFFFLSCLNFSHFCLIPRFKNQLLFFPTKHCRRVLSKEGVAPVKYSPVSGLPLLLISGC